MRYLSHCILMLMIFFFNEVFACEDLLPSNINKINVPTMNTGQSSVGGITDFSTKNNDCTLDCRCEFNSKTASWEVNVSAKRTCVFMNQCMSCKSTDKECEIRFRDLQTSSLYKKTFYANDPKKYVIQKCNRTNLNTIECKEIANLPNYDEVKPLT